MTKTVYLKCQRNVVSSLPDVYVSDVASLRCQDKQLTAKLNTVKVYHFSKQEARRCVISALHVIKLLEETCPDISVEVIGESDILLEWVDVPRKPWKQWLKVAFVCLICFFGTAFTIMAYHNDVSINTLFGSIYKIVMNREPQGITLMEVSYSIGLAVGISVFFNHVGTKRITKDPTPIEVAMRIYEEDVDRSIIETAERSGWEIEGDDLDGSHDPFRGQSKKNQVNYQGVAPGKGKKK